MPDILDNCEIVIYTKVTTSEECKGNMINDIR